jgi:hypothetical protein
MWKLRVAGPYGAVRTLSSSGVWNRPRGKGDLLLGFRDGYSLFKQTLSANEHLLEKLIAFLQEVSSADHLTEAMKMEIAQNRLYVMGLDSSGILNTEKISEALVFAKEIGNNGNGFYGRLLQELTGAVTDALSKCEENTEFAKLVQALQKVKNILQGAA